MKPVADKGLPGCPLALGDLTFMVREDVVLPPCMNIKGFPNNVRT